jgi:hypothetical protein
LRIVRLSEATLPSKQRGLHLGRVRALQHPARGDNEETTEECERDDGNPPVVAGKERSDSGHG